VLQDELFNAQMQLALLQSLESAGPAANSDSGRLLPAKLTQVELKSLLVSQYAESPAQSDAARRKGSADTDVTTSSEMDMYDEAPPECSICWGEFMEGEDIMALPCNQEHKFHKVSVAPLPPYYLLVFCFLLPL
jgi:hypothetical protein